jgi:predicted nuclease of predicted toxin-antitoxin system
LTEPYIRKRREPCVLFLDDAFDTADAEQLKAGGFCRIETFPDHFKREDGGKEQGVKDPRILRLCNTRKWLLVTTDSDLRHTHVEVIKSLPDLAILATAHNNVSDLDEWVGGLVKARARIEREFKNRQRPWFAQFNRQGTITTIYTLTGKHSSRRVRPLEE